MFEHRDPDSIFIISGRGYKEPMQKFVDDSLNIGADLKLVCGW